MIDVVVFTDWLAAPNEELRAFAADIPTTGYVPDPTKLSGFLYERFCDELRPAFDAWIATRPLRSTDSPPTPVAI